MRDSVWVTCAHPECSRGTYADPHHITNICAAGGWYCAQHDREDRTDAA
jgi:hypothetical protein